MTRAHRFRQCSSILPWYIYLVYLTTLSSWRWWVISRLLQNSAKFRGNIKIPRKRANSAAWLKIPPHEKLWALVMIKVWTKFKCETEQNLKATIWWSRRLKANPKDSYRATEQNWPKMQSRINPLGAPCHATTGVPGSNATTALVTFVRHSFYFLQCLGLIVYTYFVVTYNVQTFCHFVWYDKTDKCKFTFVDLCKMFFTCLLYTSDAADE